MQGIEARKQEIANFLTSMPDFEFKLIGIAANGDFVATELVGTGTSTGPAIIPGRDLIPASGRHVEFGMAGFFRLTPEGLVAEERYYYGRLTMIQQLNPPSQRRFPAFTPNVAPYQRLRPWSRKSKFCLPPA